MEIRPHRTIHRRKTKKIKVGNVLVGGDSQISVQSMTNTLTTDVKATVRQINSLEEAGADIVRVSCPDEESTRALKEIVKEVKVPIVADIHFHYKRALMPKDFKISNPDLISSTGSEDKETLIVSPIPSINNWPIPIDDLMLPVSNPPASVIETVKKIRKKKLSHLKEPITLSIIGCVVNGPGEAAQTEVGLTGGGQDNNLLYLSGIPHEKVASADIIDKVVKLVEEKVKQKNK